MSRISKNDVKSFERNNLTRLYIYLAFTIFGAILYVKSYVRFSLLQKEFGGLFLISGALFVYLGSKEKKISISNFEFIYGLCCSLCGLLIFINPGNMINFLTFYIGLYYIVSGIFRGITTVTLLKLKKESGIITLVTSCLIIGIGTIVILNPFKTIVIQEVCALFTLFYGILSFSNMILITKDSKSIAKIK